MLLLSLPALAQANDVIEKHFSWLGDDTPGCAVGVVKGKDLVYQGYFGQANLRYQVPVERHTRFNIGSISKHMTAALIHSLERDEKLTRQDTLEKYYPDGPDWFAEVTIDHMIHHLSGLGDYANTNHTALFNALTEYLTFHISTPWQPLPTEILVEAVENDLKTLEQPANQPGEYFSYSNTAYLMLGAIAEKAAEQPFAELMQQYVFEPLGMKSTTIWQGDQPELAWSAQGYSWNQQRPPQFLAVHPMQGSPGDSSVMTTVGDFALWAANLMQPTPKAAHWQAMYQAEFIKSKSLPTLQYDFDNVAYNINGLFYLAKEDAAFFEHGGFDHGMLSLFWYEPSHRIAYFQTCNFNYAMGPEREDVLAAFSTDSAGVVAQRRQ